MFYHFFITFIILLNECNSQATEYLGNCTVKEDCSWLGANSECKYKLCMCEDGFRWYQGECQKYSGLGGNCTTDLECYDGYNPGALSCNSSEQKCTCSEGFYLRPDVDCRKKSESALGCAIDIDCPSGHKCIKSICSKMENDLYDDFIEIKIEHGIEGENEEMCDGSQLCNDTNKECYNSKCICKKGFFNVAGKENCVPEIGMPKTCINDTDCITNGQCEQKSGTCYCRDYYFTSDGNRECVKSMQQTNRFCNRREWCYALGPNSFCASSKTCNCSSVAYFDETDFTCKRNNTDPAGLCKSDMECAADIKYEICKDEICQCKDNYRQENGKCFPDIGQACDDDTECTVPNSKCVNKTCECDLHYVNVKGKCSEEIERLGDPCEVDEQCSRTILYSGCTNATCSCQGERLAYKNRCIAHKVYNSYCNNLIECKVSLGDSFFCRKGKCQCGTGVKYDEELNKCSSGLGSVIGTHLSTIWFLISALNGFKLFI